VRLRGDAVGNLDVLQRVREVTLIEGALKGLKRAFLLFVLQDFSRG
jgi:hypothetical protein